MVKNVLIVGRGIIGASLAFYLQRAGAEVTIVSDDTERATDGSFGWINASFYNDEAHFRARNAGLEAYRRLTQTLELPVNWSGCLCWENEGEALREQLSDLKQLGYAAERIDQMEFAALEPNVPNPPQECIYLPQEAAAESGALADALSDEAIRLGATTIRGHVSRLIADDDRIVGAEVDGSAVKADEVVVAAGVHTPAFVEPFGCALPMLDRPAVILKTKPVTPKFSHIWVSEIGEVRQLPDGSILMPAAVGHQSIEASPDSPELEASAQAALARLAKFTGIELELDWAKLAFRPVPKDGLPVTGRFKKGGYVAVMHSGITLAAIMGELISEEIMSGPSNQTDQYLAPYRPDRFRT